MIQTDNREYFKNAYANFCLVADRSLRDHRSLWDHGERVRPRRDLISPGGAARRRSARGLDTRCRSAGRRSARGPSARGPSAVCCSATCVLGSLSCRGDPGRYVTRSGSTPDPCCVADGRSGGVLLARGSRSLRGTDCTRTGRVGASRGTSKSLHPRPPDL